jgi:AraC family transcriptional regulator
LSPQHPPEAVISFIQHMMTGTNQMIGQTSKNTEFMSAPLRTDGLCLNVSNSKTSISPIVARTRVRSRNHSDFTARISVLDDVRRAIERNLLDGAHAAALRLVSLLSQPNEMCARGGLAPWQRRKIDCYLREHLEQPVELDQLAQQVPLSVSHFCRAFKATYGDTPHAYIIRLRLALAKEKMLATDAPLIQIALASGFADQAHLSKLFRRVMGETPSAWRRRNLTDAQVEGTR